MYCIALSIIFKGLPGGFIFFCRFESLEVVTICFKNKKTSRMGEKIIYSSNSRTKVY